VSRLWENKMVTGRIEKITVSDYKNSGYYNLQVWYNIMLLRKKNKQYCALKFSQVTYSNSINFPNNLLSTWYPIKLTYFTRIMMHIFLP